jgi:phosphoribosylformylglycinamidine (FGAM) synthase-like amidotransferase family enzyme
MQNNFWSFSPSQPSLRVLAVEWIVGPELNTLGICSGLQVLHGNKGLIDAFLPGQRITSLKWSPNVRELRHG